MNEKSYQFGKSILTLKFGDITTSTSDVTVSSDDNRLTMSGGVSSAIRRAGGETVIMDTAKNKPAKLGDVIITSAGKLNSKLIFHAISRIVSQDKQPGENKTNPKAVVNSTTLQCLKLLNAAHLSSIAFPAIGAGYAGFPYDEVAVQMAETMHKYFSENDFENKVVIYLHDDTGRMKDDDYSPFFNAFAKMTPIVAKTEISKIKIFLASSSELKDDRTQFEVFIGRENKVLINQRVFLDLTIWEDFVDAVSKTRSQDEYNKEVINSDFFLVLVSTKVGKYSLEEFQVALNAFKISSRPQVYVYLKDTLVSTVNMKLEDMQSLINFKKQLADIDYFPPSYENIDHLKLDFRDQLRKILHI